MEEGPFPTRKCDVMKKFVLVSGLLLTRLVLFAQDQPATHPKGNGHIFGIVNDSTVQHVVEFANVAISRPNSKQPIDGAVCDLDGKFSITKIAPGTYDVTFSFIGLETKTIHNVVVHDKKGEVDMGTINLGPVAKLLKEVTVEGQRTLVEEKVDRTVYNAEYDQTAKGGDATDVLKRVPMLSVDMDGNVSLRGSQNIKVLINNKPSTITASSIADALKQIPADQIKTVEVITSPSAKYDAEGSAGIINIITKKNTMQGATLNVDGSAGYRGSNLGLNGGYRKGKMGFTLGGFGRANYNTPGSFYNHQVTTDSIRGGPYHVTTIQNANTRNQGLFGNYTLGWDYDINKNNSITASVRFGVRDSHTYQDHLLTNTSADTTGNVPFSTLKNVNTQSISNTVDASVNYTHTFAKPNREFNLLTLFSQNNGSSNFVNTNLNTGDLSTIGYIKNLNKSLNQESTVQADYQTPIRDNQLIEFGGKAIMRKVTSDYQYYNAGSDGNYTISTNPSLTNALNYTQGISAGYLSYTLTTKGGYSLKAGTRYEYTTIDAHLLDNEKIDIPSYGVLVPSINFSKKLSNGNVFKVAYNRRIQRPSIQYLNPNLQASNPLNITQGNPHLGPEYSNNYELAYSAYLGGSSLNFSTFARTTANAIQAVRSTVSETFSGIQYASILTTYENIGKQNAYGFSVFANVTLSNKFTLNGGTDMYYAVLKNYDPQIPIYTSSNQGWVTNFRMFGSYNFSNGWGLQFFGFYRGRQVQLQGYQGRFQVYSLSLRKEILKKKGSIGFGTENFLTPTIKITNSVVSPILNQENNNTLHYLNFKVTFSYRIGKLSFDTKKKNKMTISNDDMKEGGDSNPINSNTQQQGGGQGGNAPGGNGRQGAPGQGGQGQGSQGQGGQGQRPGMMPGQTAPGQGFVPDQKIQPSDSISNKDVNKDEKKSKKKKEETTTPPPNN
jgi:outer membrane receptor protein involved in Fe transport